MKRFGVKMAFFLWSLFWTTYVLASPCDLHQCVAVVDAGSSGSRLHVYAYDVDATDTPIHIQEAYVQRMKPGFASLTLTQSAIEAYLTQLFSMHLDRTIPVYVYATAGMRLLPEERQQQYFTALRSWFDRQPQWLLKDARTLSGTEEGVFAWLSVNEQQGMFALQHPAFISVMDVGGASTQVVFSVKKDTPIASEDLVELDVHGQPIKLFSHSFLGLGAREVSHRFENQRTCFPQGYALPNGELGQGDAVLCQQTVFDEIDATYGIEARVKPVLKENQSTSWMVLGAVSAMVKSYSLANSQMTPDILLHTTQVKRCAVEWDELHALYPNNETLASDCLLGSYYYALTVKGYGLDPTQVIHYNLDTEEMDWTLGVVLHLL